MAGLKWDVFVTPGIPVVTRDRPRDVQETVFQAMASTLIYGERDAVLVDAFLTVENAFDARYRAINLHAYLKPEELIGVPQNPRRITVGFDLRLK